MNYRPIGVSNVFSKVFERFKLDQLTFYFKNLLSEFRSAYRKQYSCQHVLLRMTEASDHNTAGIRLEFSGKTIIPSTKEIDLLGVTTDTNSHITKICRKASRQLNALKRLGFYIPLEPIPLLFPILTIVHQFDIFQQQNNLRKSRKYSKAFSIFCTMIMCPIMCRLRPLKFLKL